MIATTVADRIRKVIAEKPGCLIEDLILACPGLTWNQIFQEVDRMSRVGEVRILLKGPGLYSLSLSHGQLSSTQGGAS